MKQVVLFLVVSVLIVQIFAKPADKHSDRVKDDKPLSDTVHYAGDGHNNDYDHDAFLGEEEAKTFNDLSPDESKRRLGKIADRIDADKDGFVTETELKEWIEHQQNRYITDHIKERWDIHDENKDKIVSWDEYLQTSYGAIEEELVKLEENERMDFRTMIKRDKKRWAAADVNKDNNLDYDEFVGFIHPEEKEHMFDIVVEETMEDIDKNHDGKLTVDEYIGDMYHRKEGETESEEPEWVKTEREQFKSFRDKNGDGHMDSKEVKDWILPTDYDHAEAEAKHLVYESDTNRDQKLTRQEIVDKWDLFVGSQATDFGDALTRHDEF
ncbi:calumenin-A-like isoform X2 [Amphiura filiformis]|uniref:calumenin-A-like isoform X2 n=1 Tax=Amphiura filiformis TaxID=82378 RepID=UPI003B214E46